MRLESPAFENGGVIPSRYTCDGADISVPLRFLDVPAEAKSLALIVDDPDAPMGIFVHWVIYDIPAALEGLPEGVPPAPMLEGGIKQGVNSFGKIGYGGPCPPNGTHRYFFKLYALDTVLNLEPGMGKQELLAAMRGHVIDGAELMGLYAR